MLSMCTLLWPNGNFFDHALVLFPAYSFSVCLIFLEFFIWLTLRNLITLSQCFSSNKCHMRNTFMALFCRAMCLIDFGLPVGDDDDTNLANGQDLALTKLHSTPANGTLKRKPIGNDLDMKQNGRKNFEFCAFRDPVLFVGHLSRTSTLIIDKPWIQVVKTLDALPVHRRIFGT